MAIMVCWLTLVPNFGHRHEKTGNSAPTMLMDRSGNVCGIAISANGSRLAVCDAGRGVTVWRIPSFQKDGFFPARNCISVALSGDGQLVAFGDGKNARCIDLKAKKEIALFEGDLSIISDIISIGET